MTKKNILFLNLYSNKIKRGAESFSHQLADKLSPYHHITYLKGNSSTMPANQFSGSFINRLRKRFFIDTPALQVLLFSLKQIPHIFTSNYHLIIPLNGFWQLLILKIIQPFKGYKILITGHSGPGWDERFNLYLHPNLFIATTKPTLNWAKKTCPWTKSTLIPYGIDPKNFNPGIKLPGIKHPGIKEPIILCPAALVPYKQINLAIQAVSKLEKASLLILGQGPLKKQLNQLGKQLLGSSRFQIKSVPYSQIPSYYQLASIITLPSLPQENSPMVFIESLAANKNIVTTNAPRNRWMLQKSGYYVDPTNINLYAKTLKKALKSQPNTQTPLQKFLWPRVIQKYLKAINQL